MTSMIDLDVVLRIEIRFLFYQNMRDESVPYFHVMTWSRHTGFSMYGHAHDTDVTRSTSIGVSSTHPFVDLSFTRHRGCLYEQEEVHRRCFIHHPLSTWSDIRLFNPPTSSSMFLSIEKSFDKRWCFIHPSFVDLSFLHRHPLSIHNRPPISLST